MTDDERAAPMLMSEWTKRIRARAGARPNKLVDLAVARIEGVPGQRLVHRVDKSRGGVELVLRTRDVGQHRFPAAMKAVRIDAKRRVAIAPEQLTGSRPDHLPLRPLPRELPKQLQRARFVDRTRAITEGHSEITSVYNPDERFTFSDTSFPWCTCGLVETGAGNGSGVLIGPRHLLTASHAINWGPNNTAGWLKFAPLSFDGSEPFGFAYGTTIYWWLQADSDHDGSMNDTEVAFDHVVVVLDRRLGDVAGWMGSRAYDTGWNGGDYWGHIGYPGDMAGGRRPAFIGYQNFDGTFQQATGGRTSLGIEHEIDVWPGQSGGPYFGWWAGEAWPRVVGVQSGQNRGGAGGKNTGSGGNPLPELVSFARGVAP